MEIRSKSSNWIETRPEVIFFNPKPSFFKWLKQYAAGRIVFDVGCGEGRVLRKAVDAGIRMIGVEPFWRNAGKKEWLGYHVIEAFGERCPLLHATENALVLFCRPCHDGFVARTVQMLHHTSEALYISKPGNRHVDLPGFDVESLFVPKLAGQARIPGCDEEMVYKINPPYPEIDESPDYAAAGFERLQALMKGNDDAITRRKT